MMVKPFDLVPCPECQGKGYYEVFGTFGERPRKIPCDLCWGIGKRPRERTENPENAKEQA